MQYNNSKSAEVEADVDVEVDVAADPAVQRKRDRARRLAARALDARDLAEAADTKTVRTPEVVKRVAEAAFDEFASDRRALEEKKRTLQSEIKELQGRLLPGSLREGADFVARVQTSKKFNKGARGAGARSAGARGAGGGDDDDAGSPTATLDETRTAMETEEAALGQPNIRRVLAGKRLDLALLLRIEDVHSSLRLSPVKLALLDKKRREYEDKVEEAKAEGKPEPPMPKEIRKMRDAFVDSVVKAEMGSAEEYRKEAERLQVESFRELESLNEEMAERVAEKMGKSVDDPEVQVIAAKLVATSLASKEDRELRTAKVLQIQQEEEEEAQEEQEDAQEEAAEIDIDQAKAEAEAEAEVGSAADVEIESRRRLFMTQALLGKLGQEAIAQGEDVDEEDMVIGQEEKATAAAEGKSEEEADKPDEPGQEEEADKPDEQGDKPDEQGTEDEAEPEEEGTEDEAEPDQEGTEEEADKQDEEGTEDEAEPDEDAEEDEAEGEEHAEEEEAEDEGEPDQDEAEGEQEKAGPGLFPLRTRRSLLIPEDDDDVTSPASSHIPVDTDDLHEMLERYYEITTHLRPRSDKATRDVVNRTIRQILSLRRELEMEKDSVKKARTQKLADKVVVRLRRLAVSA